VRGRAIPVPTDVSPELQSAIAAPYRSLAWNLNPRTPEEWKQAIPPLREKLGVVSQETTIGGVHAYIVRPKDIPPQNQNRLLFHIHEGGYGYNPGEAGTQEAATELAKRILANPRLSNFAIIQALPLIAQSEPDAGLLPERLMVAATLNGGEARNRAQAFLKGKAAKAMPATGVDEERGAR
jgi:hypothetical protein